MLLWLVPAAVLVAILAWWRLRPRPLERVLAAHGAARCLAALALLRDLGEAGDEAAIAAAWERLEEPLLHALPDCPPEAKPKLVEACDVAARACANRALAKRIMAARNRLV